MNWDAVGAIGEVVGAAGVIITLGYLAVQIRQNTASHRAAAVQALTEASASFNDLLASDADLGRIVASGAADLDSLPLEERPRFYFALLALLRRVENTQRQTRQGRLSREDWVGIHASTMYLMSQPGCRSWWAETSDRFNPDFSEWLDRELEKYAARQRTESTS